MTLTQEEREEIIKEVCKNTTRDFSEDMNRSGWWGYFKDNLEEAIHLTEKKTTEKILNMINQVYEECYGKTGVRLHWISALNEKLKDEVKK